ncbi:MAG: TPM domain-containing protein [Flavobacteriaceae bacterium]|jgi:uncharacterized membrane protein|nr:TPM domain-containing protein [Flavobacteriaceae bacterium]MDG1310386.1 TPM domain-containing protein [Flavobacteriaceae bacterium]|tara:strand:- start:1980 stop:2426 length:447 start_codon:yes stop_codon:yes gene_type:complete
MVVLENFLSTEEENEIVEAIRQAEQNTSGEIRVHIENSSSLPIEERAKEVFHHLKMDRTKLQNGVLIYIAVSNHQFGIFGDKGIDTKVNSTFWNDTRDVMRNLFKKGEFKDGIIQGIQTASKALESHFPWESNDTNELSDSISKGSIL